MTLSVFITLALIFPIFNASSNLREEPMTRTSGATWLQNPQIGRSTERSDNQDDVINMKDLLNELQFLEWTDLELKKHPWLRFVAAKPRPIGSKFSFHERDYSRPDLSPNELRTKKFEKRLINRYHRQFLTKALESIKNGRFKPAMLNFDLGKRSSSWASDTEDQIDQMDNMKRRYREHKTGQGNGLGLSQLYMNYVNQQYESSIE